MPLGTLGAVSNASFDSKQVGVAKPITFDSTFTDDVYALYANLGAPAGTYQARANVLVRPLTISATTDTRDYNGSISSVAIPTAVGMQTGDTLNGTMNQTFASKDVLGTGNSTLVANGTYTVSDGNGGHNYTVTLVNAPGTISPVGLTVTANDVSKTYGETPALTGFKTSPLVNGETVGSVTQSSAGQLVSADVLGSPYVIALSNVTGGTFASSNYSITYVNGSLVVTPAILTVTANDVSKVYGETPSLTGFKTSPLVNGETVGSVTQSSVGQLASADVLGSPYVITVSSATGGTFAPSNYSITYVNSALTVTPVDVMPPVVTPPVVVPPVITPPLVVPPEVIPPVVVPPVVTPPVFEPPVVVIPEVIPPVIVPPVVTPPVVEPTPVVPLVLTPPVVLGESKDTATAVNGGQAMPLVPVHDVDPGLLTVAPHPRMAQGPLMFFAVAPRLIQQEKLSPRLVVLPVRPPKQDRN
jgi:hypothetical protein